MMSGKPIGCRGRTAAVAIATAVLLIGAGETSARQRDTVAYPGPEAGVVGVVGPGLGGPYTGGPVQTIDVGPGSGPVPAGGGCISQGMAGGPGYGIVHDVACPAGPMVVGSGPGYGPVPPGPEFGTVEVWE